MNLPNDPAMLLSVINLKLRDFYSTLDELCKDLQVEKEMLIQKLSQIDYHYDEVTNQFN